MATQTVNEGTTIRFYTSTPFTSISGTVVDPDIVTFQYVLPNTSPVSFTYTNGSGDPTHTIVRVSTGNYYANVNTTGLAGNWTWRWAGKPGPSGLDTTHTAVAVEGVVTVLANDMTA